MGRLFEFRSILTFGVLIIYITLFYVVIVVPTFGVLFAFRHSDFCSSDLFPLYDQIGKQIFLIVFHFECFILNISFYHPINNIEGIHVDFSRLSDWMSMKNLTDFENLLKRYKNFKVLAEQVCDVLRLAVKEKRINHQNTMVTS